MRVTKGLLRIGGKRNVHSNELARHEFGKRRSSEAMMVNRGLKCRIIPQLGNLSSREKLIYTSVLSDEAEFSSRCDPSVRRACSGIPDWIEIVRG